MKIDRKKILREAKKIINNAQLGFVSKIEVPIQEVKAGECKYELSLVIKIKK